VKTQLSAYHDRNRSIQGASEMFRGWWLRLTLANLRSFTHRPADVATERWWRFDSRCLVGRKPCQAQRSIEYHNRQLAGVAARGQQHPSISLIDCDVDLSFYSKNPERANLASCRITVLLVACTLWLLSATHGEGFLCGSQVSTDD
jgi:hypothetical protein